MRSLKELYEILLDNIQTERSICFVILDMGCVGKITWEESELLSIHFKSIKRPRYRFNYLFNNPDKVNRYKKSNFYWKKGYMKPRIKFIKEIIKTLK